MAWNFYWIDPDSVETQLGQISSSKILRFSGLGMAPLEHFLQEIPSQHRQLHRGMKFRPRLVQLELVDRQSSASNQDTRHQTLLAALNPKRGEGTLKVVLSDGTTTRYLGCRVQDGPDFESSGRPRAAGDQIYAVRLVARDPFLYNPSQQSASGNFNGATPVDVSVNNAGHVDTFPVITITGAVNKPKVLLVTTGEYIEFNYNLTAGHHIDVNCKTGAINLDDSAMSPLTLTKQSTLFCVPAGTQTIRLTATSGTGAFGITWYNRYLGI